MSHPALVIETREPYGAGGLAGLLASVAGFRCDVIEWDALEPGDLARCRARIIVADAARDPPQARRLFGWLGEYAVPIPSIAVLPTDPSDDLIRSAARATDDFLLAPVRPLELCHRIDRIVAHATVATAQERLVEDVALTGLVGRAPGFVQAMARIPRIARSDVPVMVTGESGTGKELCARAVHHLGPRRDYPFIGVDCAALPDHLFENEMFGHVRGAYTDAHRDQRGLVAMAQGGTLFMDEVDALSLAAQSKLLRFLQERTYRPLGADRFASADVNVVAATNRDIDACTRAGRFRADLYFRLNVLRIHLPPLRERPGDVHLLAKHFLRCESRGGTARIFTESALRKLDRYAWPGNVRELLNVVQRAAIEAEGVRIAPEQIVLPGVEDAGHDDPGNFRDARAAAVAAFERHYVVDLLRRNAGNVTRAAREAGKDRRVFGRLIKKHRIDRTER
jgi:DNA-binding NtrC family response regulator